MQQARQVAPNQYMKMLIILQAESFSSLWETMVDDEDILMACHWCHGTECVTANQSTKFAYKVWFGIYARFVVEFFMLMVGDFQRT